MPSRVVYSLLSPDLIPFASAKAQREVQVSIADEEVRTW